VLLLFESILTFTKFKTNFYYSKLSTEHVDVKIVITSSYTGVINFKNGRLGPPCTYLFFLVCEAGSR